MGDLDMMKSNLDDLISYLTIIRDKFKENMPVLIGESIGSAQNITSVCVVRRDSDLPFPEDPKLYLLSSDIVDGRNENILNDRTILVAPVFCFDTDIKHQEMLTDQGVKNEVKTEFD